MTAMNTTQPVSPSHVDTPGDVSRVQPMPDVKDALGQFIAQTDFTQIRPKGEPISRLAD